MNRTARDLSGAVARQIGGGPSRAVKVSLPTNAIAAAPTIRILLAGDQPMARDGLRSLLTTQADFRVIAEARNRDEVIYCAHKMEPDVMLLDLSMASDVRLDIMRELKLAALRMRTIVIAAEMERGDLIELLQFGGRGVVLRDSPTELLFKCIRCVQQGEVWISRQTAAQIVEFLAARAFAVGPPKHVHDNEPIRVFSLTAREREILKMVANGESNKGVAERLSIGRDTVKHHLTNMFNKTGTSTRLELALFAFDHRLVARD